MNKTQRHWKAISAELRSKITSSGMSASQLAEFADIDYHAARRILIGSIKNSSGPAKALCKHFKIDLYENAKSQIDDRMIKLQLLINNVWDRSESHLDLMENLIKSTKGFTYNKSNTPSKNLTSD